MKRTVLYERHVALGGRMVEFAGWEMPVQYPTGILEEHLRTRRSAGLFDVSHMGRFHFRGPGAEAFLQTVLTNDAAALEPGRAQYTMIPTPTGGALDDAYLYCLQPEEYLLVVNASNREKDWGFLRDRLGAARGGAAGSRAAGSANLEMEDRSGELAMIALQGPKSEQILQGLLQHGGTAGGNRLPAPGRNNLCTVSLGATELTLARTGYTGEPVSFELFLPAPEAGEIWDRLVERGACPVGLGARDTLRLEAGLPLYGHELGVDAEGREIPIFACPLARFAVSLSPERGDFIGREVLERQAAVYRSITAGKRDPEAAAVLPRVVRQLSLLDKGIARQGAEVYAAGPGAGPVGRVTSGTMAPYWVFEGEGAAASPGDRTDRRAIAFALLDSGLREGESVEIEIRDRRVRSRIVPRFLGTDRPPYARAILWAEKA
ncbi:MAG: glycine cleavage system aminomethyltransferase GcvT [Spirochaetales bacterium]|nr:glycine cleavage system aminomethyltransferase GcvT [Spirochaetales bacterium]